MATPFPQFKSTPSTKRTIIGSMYDDSGDEDESEYSFVHPYGDKKCRVKHRSMLDRLATNLHDAKLFGHAIRLHAEHSVLKLLEEDYESDSSNERISKSKTINFMYDQATGCAATLHNVAGELSDINLCAGAAASSGAVSYDNNKEHQRKGKVPSPIKVVRGKKASEVEIWSGDLKDSLTDTSGEFYSSDDDTSFSGSESSYSSDESSYDSERRSYTNAKLRRMKQKFLQRRALERAAAESDSETDDGEHDGTLHRKKSNLKKIHAKPSKSNTLHTREMRPRGDVEVTTVSPEISPGATSTEPDVIDVSDGKPITLKQLQWESKEATILVSNDQAPDFLASSHIGPVITKLNRSTLSDVLQLGDVIIRLNGEDVSTLEGEFVSELLMKFEGRSIRVTYLRKTMLV
jgi:hypothetical protein